MREASGSSRSSMSLRHVSVERSACLRSGGSLQATWKGSSGRSSPGGRTHRRKQACRKSRGEISASSRTEEELYLGSETRGWPREAMCSLIWCCRPWSICTCTRL